MKVLITGGAGFIGSRLAQVLHANGHEITVLDNLSEQVHGVGAVFPEKLAAIAKCVKGDVCDREIVSELVLSQNVIVHFAAETGTGQSMYAVEQYEHVNIKGTAILLDILINRPVSSLTKIIVASSRAIYGEGQYRCETHGSVYPTARSVAMLNAGKFDPICPVCGGTVSVEDTSEITPFGPSSFYGLTKQVQEQMVLMFASAMSIDAFALRYQNVYGPGQSLSNPYTGILAVFSNLVRQGKELNIFEDGFESRDFVYVDDVVDATYSCLDPAVRGVRALNVGSGIRTSVFEVATAIIDYYKADITVNISGSYRVGDIRHNVADISNLKRVTGFSPSWKFSQGLKMFLDWASDYSVAESGYENSLKELSDRGLLGSGSKT